MQIPINSRIKPQITGTFSPLYAAKTAPAEKKGSLSTIWPAVYLKEKTIQQDTLIPFQDLIARANRLLFLVEDPLWQRICADVIHMMGPLSAQKVTKCRLGEISGMDKVAEIYCQTDEVANFLEHYAFVVVGSLKKYFPALKEIRVKIDPLN